MLQGGQEPTSGHYNNSPLHVVLPPVYNPSSFLPRKRHRPIYVGQKNLHRMKGTGREEGVPSSSSQNGIPTGLWKNSSITGASGCL